MIKINEIKEEGLLQKVHIASCTSAILKELVNLKAQMTPSVVFNNQSEVAIEAAKCGNSVDITYKTWY